MAPEPTAAEPVAAEAKPKTTRRKKAEPVEEVSS
jgi:hypothetical protein